MLLNILVIGTALASCGRAAVAGGDEYVSVSAAAVAEISRAAEVELRRQVVNATAHLLDSQTKLQAWKHSADNWLDKLEELKEIVGSHQVEFGKARRELLSAAHHQCVYQLKIRKKECLSCIASHCSDYLSENCALTIPDTDTLWDKIIQFFTRFVPLDNSGKLYPDDTSSLRRKALQYDGLQPVLREKIDEQTDNKLQMETRSLKTQTEGMINELKLGIDLERSTLPESILASEVPTSEMQSYVANAEDQIKNDPRAQSILAAVGSSVDEAREILRQDRLVLKELAKNDYTGRVRDRSVFDVVWQTTTDTVSSVVCFVSFGTLLCNDRGRRAVVQGSIEPGCDQLKNDTAVCVDFMPLCDSQCDSIDVKGMCPVWYANWNDYVRAYLAIDKRLKNILEKMRLAEAQMGDIVFHHNRHVIHVLREHGWLQQFGSNNAKLREVPLVAVEGIWFDPLRFEAGREHLFQLVNVAYRLLDETRPHIVLHQSVDLHDAAAAGAAIAANVVQSERALIQLDDAYQTMMRKLGASDL